LTKIKKDENEFIDKGCRNRSVHGVSFEKGIRHFHLSKRKNIKGIQRNPSHDSNMFL